MAQAITLATMTLEVAVPKLKVQIPEPTPFNGMQCSKELENFLWDVEQFFSANHVTKVERVQVGSAYLADDAKLWWHTKATSVTELPSLTYEQFKEELQAQFLLANSVSQAWSMLMRLKRTSPIHEYIRAFSMLMLEIPDMLEANQLFLQEVRQ